MARNPQPCPLCRGTVSVMSVIGGPDIYGLDCQHCGVFHVEVTLPKLVWVHLKPDEQVLLASLPHYLRHENQRGRTPFVTAGNWKVFARKGHNLAQSRRP